MSIGILISVHEGIVLAADSASTLTLVMPGPSQPSQPAALNVYNNANKIANLYKGLPIGCVAYGAGSIGSASISTLLKDFRAWIAGGGDTGFDPKTYTMEAVATSLMNFLMDRVKDVKVGPRPTLGILLGGYSCGSSLGSGWILQIENGVAKSPSRLRKEDEVGITWGGESEAISRLVLGFSQSLPQVLRSAINPRPSDSVIQQLTGQLAANLQAPIVFAPMPIQDTIDLAEFLVHTAIMYSRFLPGPPTVGGPIEIAAITKHEGFKWIRRKHYYSKEFNQRFDSELAQ